MAMMVKVGDFLNYFFLMIEYNDNDGQLTSVVLTFFAIIFKKDASLICFTDSMVTLLPTNQPLLPYSGTDPQLGVQGEIQRKLTIFCKFHTKYLQQEKNHAFFSYSFCGKVFFYYNSIIL